MLERLIEELLGDESLTRGLSESEAQELLSWLIGLLEEDTDEREGRLIRQLGRKLARLAQRHRVPVEELIELVELAWGEEVPSPPEPEPRLQA